MLRWLQPIEPHCSMAKTVRVAELDSCRYGTLWHFIWCLIEANKRDWVCSMQQDWKRVSQCDVKKNCCKHSVTAHWNLLLWIHYIKQLWMRVWDLLIQITSHIFQPHNLCSQYNKLHVKCTFLGIALRSRWTIHRQFYFVDTVGRWWEIIEMKSRFHPFFKFFILVNCKMKLKPTVHIFYLLNSRLNAWVFTSMSSLYISLYL